VKIDSNDNIHVAYKAGDIYYRKLTYNSGPNNWSVGPELVVDPAPTTPIQYYGISISMGIDSNDRVYITTAYQSSGSIDTLAASYVDPPYTTVVTDDADIDHYADGAGPGGYGNNLICEGADVYLYHAWGTELDADVVYWKREGSSWGSRQTILVNAGETWEPDGVVITDDGKHNILVNNGSHHVYFLRGTPGGSWDSLVTVDYSIHNGEHGSIFTPDGTNIYIASSGSDYNNERMPFLKRRIGGSWDTPVYLIP
jgi:hypothetical protein